jgi:hypothetical protein
MAMRRKDPAIRQILVTPIFTGAQYAPHNIILSTWIWDDAGVLSDTADDC